jgi:hypothetical protein
MSGIMGVVIFWPLELILAAALITKIRKRAVLGGPSPEQQFTKAVFRPLWMLPAVLFLLAIVLLFLQALHRR